MNECRYCELFSLVKGWLAEANGEGVLDDSTRATLRECAADLAGKLPPHNHMFHDGPLHLDAIQGPR